MHQLDTWVRRAGGASKDFFACALWTLSMLHDVSGFQGHSFL
jgi:hypothetical protein